MSRKTKYRKLIIAVLALGVLVGCFYFGSAALEQAQQREKSDELLAQDVQTRESAWSADNTVCIGGNVYGFDHRIETYLFIGLDNSGNRDPENYLGGMADFLLLMVLDHTDNTIGYLQIDRNTMADVRELTVDGEEITIRALPISAAHWYGRNPVMAAENTVYAVRQFLGGLWKIDGYFVLDFRDVGLMNRAVGGVEVTITDEELEKYDPALKQGVTVVLTDTQAERFVRTRRGTNAKRMVRQREYMDAFFRKVKERTMEDPMFGLKLWNTLREAAVSDMNGNDFSRIAQKLLKGTDKGILTLKGETILGGVMGTGRLDEELFVEDSSILEVMSDLFSLVPVEKAQGNTKSDQ